MYRSLELNQYKLRIHFVFLAKSFKVGHEVELPVAGWDKPRITDCVPSAFSNYGLACLSPGSHHYLDRPGEMKEQIVLFL